MAKHTFACFNCRTTTRREVPDAYDNPGDISRFPRCPSCTNEMDYVGHRGRLPTKANVKGWAAFKVVLDERKLAEGRKWVGRILGEIASLEQQIAKLEDQPKNPSSKSNINAARKQMRFLKSEIAGFLDNENKRYIGLI
jgi:uncharacterized protein YdcH (DUF465 family)